MWRFGRPTFRRDEKKCVQCQDNNKHKQTNVRLMLKKKKKNLDREVVICGILDFVGLPNFI